MEQRHSRGVSASSRLPSEFTYVTNAYSSLLLYSKMHTSFVHCKAGNMLTWKNEDLEIRDRKVYAPMEDIISDYQGPFRILSLVHGHSGVCWFMDRRTKLTGAFPVKSKSEALEQLKIFITSCRALQDSFSGTSYKLHVSPRLISSDQGGEQMGKEWDSYAHTNGITRVFSGL